jgi:hypothetical protein
MAFVLTTCHVKETSRPDTTPDALPAPFGPLHVPERAFPDCANLQTGLACALLIVALTLHVPA